MIAGGHRAPFSRSLPQLGVIVTDPPGSAVVEAHVQPWRTLFNHFEFGPRVQWAGKLQGVTLTIPFTDGRFPGHDDTVPDSAILPMHQYGRTGKQDKKEGADAQ